MGMTRRTKKVETVDTTASNADVVALELMKQLITLASGVLAISATFIGRLEGVRIYLLVLLAISWLALLTSIYFGLDTISAIVQSRLDPEENQWSEGYGKTSARISKYSFIAGISLFAIFTFLALIQPKETAPGKPQTVSQPATSDSSPNPR